MPTEKINKVGSTINTWIGIGIMFVSGISSAVIAHYNIGLNTEKIQGLREDVLKEIEEHDDRQDRRRDHVKQDVNEIKKIGLDLDRRVRDLEQENAAQKAQIEILLKNK